MLFDNNGPDIPISLLRAQRAGNLLFIVGAGVSKTARLPLFGELADLVYDHLGQAVPGAPGSLASRAELEARQTGQYDRLIGLLEQRLVYRGVDWRQPHNTVRQAVAALVQPGLRAHIKAHADLLDLSRAIDGRPRIVTTNFDTLFERAWRRRTGQHLISSAGPGMPAVGSHDFTGVLHLHGRVGDRRYGLSETDLVLTSANFGEAYMRSGWASRFVYDLLRRYSLVLVGYSADDPPMRYMLEATEEGRLNFPDLNPAFALVGDTGKDAGALREEWRGKGVQPLVYSAPENDHGALYRTLRSWAQLAREPLEWSESELARIAARNREEATAEDKASFSYLTKEVSSVKVAAMHATDPAWIEEILPADSNESWSFIAWFDGRLESAEAARYAASASDILKLQISRAVDILLRTRQEPLADLYQRFWLLYVQANIRTADNPYGRMRKGAVTTNRIQELVNLVEPRLRVERKFRWGETDDVGAEPVNVHDLAHFSFQASDRDWHRHLERWPREGAAEERLLLALDRSLCEAIELGSDAGLIQADGDLMSFDLALVHAPEADEGLIDPNDRHKSNWRLNQPDAYNSHFAPLVRMMTGLWRRFFGSEANRASRIAVAWAERDALIFKRLAAWAAVEGDSATGSTIEGYLRTTTRKRYWQSDNSPELVRFYCKRWNQLAPKTRQAIERAILAGMLPDVIQRIARPGSRAYARTLYTARELVRIRTAGGRLSREASRRLKGYYRAFPDLPREMPIYAYLYNPSWSGSGYSADIRVLDEVSDTQLLESAEAFETDNRIEQADLWRVFARNEPLRAFAALRDAQAKDEFPAHRWRPFLNLYAFPEAEQAPEECPPLGDVLQVVAQVPGNALAGVAYHLARVIERHARAIDDPLFPQILALWDQLAPVAAALEEDERDGPLSEWVFSHPLGTIADSLVSMLDAMHLAPGSGIPEGVSSRFDLLVQLEGRAGLIARGALLQQFAFLRAIAPRWVDINLLPSLLRQNDDVIDLMSVIAHSVAPKYPELFNILKPAIFHTLEHERTDEAVREHLSGALIGAAFAIIAGKGGFNLTSVECRQTLTRMPDNVLARMAWELGSLLRDNEGAAAKAVYWDTAIAPFLRDYWPNDVSARTSKVSENLTRLPALAGGAFERAVPVVLDLVCPIQVHELRYRLGLEDDEDLLMQQPRASLLLISSIIDRLAPPPYDLGEVIERLLSADPNIASEPAFWRLRQMRRVA